MKKGVICALSLLAGGVCGVAAIGKIATDKLDRIQEMSDKFQTLFLVMNRWVKVKQEGKNLSSYFESHGYKKIAVYGVSFAGETLIRELMHSDIKVDYGIDQREAVYTYVDVVTMNCELPEVDAIVVTAITYYDEIEEKLREKVDCPIISLEDVLYDI